MPLGLRMEDVEESDVHLTSAIAFVEGGIQEACEDSCSICLEDFSDSEPSTVTSCNHEFHLQCILEWCQRSSQCPMCWQPISLKDYMSQELLEGVERERNVRLNPPRSTTIFRHPTLGDFELQHLPIGTNDAELEERIIQHLNAAASMRRARHIVRREGQMNRSSAQGRPQVVMFSSHPNTTLDGPTSSSSATLGDDSAQIITPQLPPPAIIANIQYGSSINNGSSFQSSPSSQDRAGPSDFQSFSESLKSRFNSMSIRYKESISKSTKGWKEKWFSRNTAISDLAVDIKGEGDTGITTLSPLMELDNNGASTASVPNTLEDIPVAHINNQQMPQIGDNSSLSDTSSQEACHAGSGSN